MKNLREDLLRVEGADLCSNVYLLLDDERVLMIDCGDGSNFNEIQEALKGKELSKVILTHGHWDHIGGMCHIKTNGMLHGADLSIIVELNSVFPNFSKLPENLLQLKSSSLKFGKFELEIIHTPGHTPGSVCIFEKKKKILFSGDTLFADGFFGRTDLIGGNYNKLMKSLEMIKKLDYKLLCPGHNETEGVV